jgi:hypothetical protein
MTESVRPRERDCLIQSLRAGVVPLCKRPSNITF